MPDPVALATLAHTMAVDAFTAEVVGALHRRGVRPILLKGPVLAGWLYDPAEPRPYTDCDLLVAPARIPEAEAVLAELGFERQIYGWEQRTQRVHHAGTWYRRADTALVDLHHTLAGIRGATPEAVWRVLARHTVPWPLPPHGVLALAEPARAVLVGLHLFHHLDQGEEWSARPLADLERALARVDLATWREAAALAAELRAGADLARALCAAEGGRELARAIGLPPPSSGLEATAGLERLAGIRGAAEWAAALRRAAFPSPAYLRWSSPLARRGRAGLAATYVLRPLWLVGNLVTAARLAWRRRRRAERA